MRDVLVNRQLQHLRIDQDQPHLAGGALYSKLSSMALIATDLPEPVVPATSRCGILFRFATTGLPPISFAQG